MVSFDWYNRQDSWVLPTKDFGNTEVIGLSFVFLAYFLHPAVAAAFQRVKAYRGWRAIEKRQTVEVTTYPLWEEIFCGRKRWDTARIVAVLLAAFSLASWGLELQLDLAYYDGYVTDLYLRPPPVWTKGDNGSWYVESPSGFLNLTYDEMGTNMFGSFSCGTANAIYKREGPDPDIEGVVRVASWSNVTNSASKLSYNDNGTGIAHVTSHNCQSPVRLGHVYVGEEKEPWGDFYDCGHREPRKKNHNNSTAHVLKLANMNTGDEHFIIEESSTSPSFLYSVWKAKHDTDGSSILSHVFHISSSARLAEALVTEIIHAPDRVGGPKTPTGGGAFALLRKFSQNNSTYGINPTDRATPFGELPTDETLVDTKLSTLETIEAGIELNTTALLCAVWLMVLTLVGIAWSFLLRFKIGMDVYDRDELIRSVTLQASLDDANHSSKMRIFVRKDDNGNLSVMVSDFQELQKGCLRIFRKEHQTVAVNDPVPNGMPNHASGSGGSTMAPGSHTVWLEGVRMGKGRAFPGRRGNYRYPTSIALSASPVPSRVGSIAGTPVPLIASSASIPLPNRPVPNLGHALFDSINDLDESERHGSDVEIARTTFKWEPNAEPCKKRGVLSPSPLQSRQTKDFNRWGLQVHSESTATVNDRPKTPPAGGAMIRPAVGLPERSGEPTAASEESNNDLNSHNETG